MLIYEIASKSFDPLRLLSPFGIEIRNIVPSAFSFLTSMRIATACKAEKPAAVIVFSRRDAIAAISARKISGTAPYPVFLFITADTKLEPSIPRDVANGVDALLFDSETTRAKWAGVKNVQSMSAEIVPVPGPDTRIERSRRHEGGKPLIGHVGPITDGRNLKQVFDDIITLADEQRPDIVVAGTGKAAVVMPLVKKCRANKLAVEWKGDEYDVETLLGGLDAFIPGGPSFNSLEKRMLANGIPSLNRYSRPITRKELTALGRQAEDTYNTFFRPDIAAEKLRHLVAEFYK